MDNKESFMEYAKQRIKRKEEDKKKHENDIYDYHVKSVQRACKRGKR